MNEPEDAIFTPLYTLHFNVLKTTAGMKLSNEQRKQIDSILMKHAQVFSGIGKPSSYTIHKIETGNKESVASPLYRLSYAKARELKGEIENMLEGDIIEECE